MPQYNSNGGGGEDLYSDSAPDQKPASDPKDDEQDQGETCLVPKSLCPDMKPGDKIALNINRALEDDYECTYAPKEKEQEPAEAPAPTDGGDPHMASMME